MKIIYSILGVLFVVVLVTQIAPISAQTCLASDPSDSKSFGSALAVSDKYLAVGDPDANRVVLYSREPDGNWSRIKNILPPKGSSADKAGKGFGYSLALNDNTLVIGAYLEVKRKKPNNSYQIQQFGSVYFAPITSKSIGTLREISIPDTDLLVGHAVSFLKDRIAFTGKTGIWEGQVLIADSNTGKITSRIKPPKGFSDLFGLNIKTADESLLISANGSLPSVGAYLATINGKLEKILFDEVDNRPFSTTGSMAISEDLIAIGRIGAFGGSDTLLFRQSANKWLLVGTVRLHGFLDASNSRFLISSTLEQEMVNYNQHSSQPDYLLFRVDADKVVIESEIRWRNNTPVLEPRGVIDSEDLLLSAEGRVVQLPIANLSSSYVIKRPLRRICP
ncbi:hypothetical protein NIES267_08530 [Calothrix parasitica NIES-267]|uniref:Uncharacterized protein n=1 Tax=Calothrix parasitica NIES-267 TaxID=1973488 RepID=A0A1Z4LJF4_9CYAN|nr:hypothetical protein NIES267_08530 [Calothrix parasitica NIES-267]